MMMTTHRALCCVAAVLGGLAAPPPTPVSTLDLAVSAWTLTSADPTYPVSVPARVPGQAHLDLLASGFIGEPFAGDYSARNATTPPSSGWVGSSAVGWLYSAEFSTPANFAGRTRVELVADGLDTVARVELNGAVIGEGANAFRRWVWRAPVAPAGAGNTIAVALASPVAHADNASAACDDFCPPLGSSGQANSSFPGFNYIRKPPVHFGWDFAPPLPSLGIWKGLRLRAYSGAAIDNVHASTAAVSSPLPSSPSDTAWSGVTWEASFAVAITAADLVDGVLSVAVDGGRAVASVNVSLSPGPSVQRIALNITGVAPWWPRTLGAASLYNATVTLMTAVPGGGGSLEVDSRTLRLGFREVEQLTPAAPDGQAGSLLRYTVNGVGVWIKGANWVPPDMFLSRASS